MGQHQAKEQQQQQQQQTLGNKCTNPPKPCKVLLLGTSDGGKTTIFDQLRYGLETRNETQSKYYNEQTTARSVLSSNCINALVSLACESYDRSPLYDVDESNKATMEMLKNYRYDDDIKQHSKLPKIGHPELDALVAFWQDPAIQRLFMDRSQCGWITHVRDRIDYCLNHMERYADDDDDEQQMTLTDYEMALAVIRTTGVVENWYSIPNERYPKLTKNSTNGKVSLWDVGGERQERKKWIHGFENVSAVVFVISLTEYQYSLAEDTSINRLDESRKLAGEIINSRWFPTASAAKAAALGNSSSGYYHSCPIFIVLNKYDQFCENLPSVPFSSKIEDYHGSEDPNSIIKWIQDDIKTKAKTQECADRLVFLSPITAHGPDECRSMFRVVVEKMEENCL